MHLASAYPSDIAIRRATSQRGEYNASWWGSDGAAILLAYAAARADGKTLYIPAGDWSFASAATFVAANNVSIRGDGSGNTNLIYAGASTTADCFTIGDSASNCVDWNISGLTFRSSTTMTAGVGVHIHRLCRSVLDDVTIDGQDGTGKFYHGIRFDGADNVVWTNFEARAAQDVVQVNGLVGVLPKADLLLENYKIGFGTVGLRCGGGFGGLYVGAGAIAGHSSHGIAIDDTLVAEINREVFIGEHCIIDANGGDGINVDQTTSTQCFIDVASRWVSSNTGNGINVVAYSGGKMVVRSYIYNNDLDGLRISDTGASVHSESVYNTNGGYGINPTVAATLLTLGINRFIGSVSGHINTTNVTPSTAVVGPLNVSGITTIDRGAVAGSGDLVLVNDSAAGPALKFDCAGNFMYIRLTGAISQILNSAFNAANLQWTDAGAFTFRSTIIAPAGTTAIPSLRVPHGAAPTSPTDGDMWTTTAGLYVRINGATVGPLS